VLRTRIIVLAAIGASVLAVVSGAAGNDPGPGFRLGDASAACRLRGETVVCRSLAVPLAVALSERGSPRRAREPIWWDASTPVLDTWHRYGVACAVRDGRITCTNSSGKGLEAGPDGIAAAL
jgi:hypothetical protein